MDAAALGGRSPAERRHLSRDEFAAAARGADPADLTQVEEFARAHGLRVVESSPERRSIVLSGRAADVCDAFGVELNRYRHPEGDFRGHQGPVLVPAELAELVEGVFGLDDRPQARPRFRIACDPAARAGSFTAPQVAALYRSPPD